MLLGGEDLHINALEMKAVILALNAFVDRLAGESVILVIDNATVVAYLREQRDTIVKALCSLAQEIVMWLEIQ